MKTRLRAVARTGTFGSKENAQTVTEKDLEELCDSFKTMNTSPITIGHDFKAQDPRLGNVVALEMKDGVLYAKTQEHDALFSAVEDGFFPMSQSEPNALQKRVSSTFIILPILEKSRLQ